MKNGFESVAQQRNPLDSISSSHFSPSISNKTNHYYNHFFNSKNNNNSPPSVIGNIQFNHYSSPKYKNKKRYNNQSNNDKKTFSMNLFRKPIITEPSCGLEKFLPNKVSQKNKTLVIDLDETLVHSYFDKNPPRKPDISFEITIDKKTLKVNTLIRPGAIDFLEKMSEIFEIVIFTASLRVYALPIINFIDKNNKCEFKLFREHCSILNNGFIKDLKKLSRDLNNLILLDNNPKCYFLNKENGIPIKTWTDDLSDKELFKIIPYLTFLSNENIKDIRPIIKIIKEGNTINYYKFDKIIKKYKKRQIIKNDNNIIKIKYKIKNEEKVDENVNIFNQYNDNINQKEEMNKENVNKLNIDNEKNNFNNKINNCVQIENKEENKTLNIDQKRFNNIFKNRIKSSHKNRFNISQPKKKDISNEIMFLNNNLIDRKISLNQINTPKKIINNSLNHFNKEVFNNKNNNSSLFIMNNTNNSRDITKTDILPKLTSKNKLKPIINSLKYSSNFRDDLKNDEKYYQKSTLCNEYKYKNNYNMPYINNINLMKIHSQKGNILFHTLRNFKYINTINNMDFDYSENNKDSEIKNNNNYKFKDNKFLLKKCDFSRSNSQKDELLDNNKSNKNDNDYNNFNKMKNIFQDNSKDYNIKPNRCLSSSKNESTLKNKYPKNIKYRCFTSTNHYISNNNNNYKNTSSNTIINNINKNLYIRNKNRNLSSRINTISYLNKNIFNYKFIREQNYNQSKVNKNDINKDEQFNRNKKDLKYNFLKTNINDWKNII